MIKKGAIIMIFVLIVIALLYIQNSKDDLTETTLPAKEFPTIDIFPDVTTTTLTPSIDDTVPTTITLPSTTTTTISSTPTTLPIFTASTIISGSNKIIVTYRKFSENEIVINKGETIMFEPDDPVRFFKIACYFDGARFFSSENIYDKETVEVSFKEIGSYTCIDSIYGPRLSIEVK
ncbi:MAG: hypothetical protein V1740_01315 [Candidatus Woesearchaeota archaeon]